MKLDIFTCKEHEIEMIAKLQSYSVNHKSKNSYLVKN